MKIMGLDIGGANTDCSIIELNNNLNRILSSKHAKKYFPMWKDNNKLKEFLLTLSENEDIDIVCVTMTAELADSYSTKKEGVLDIAKKVMETFPDKKVKFVTFDGLKDYSEIIKKPLSVAAANWMGTAQAINFIKKNCIFMDMGTTTTDIIPIKNSKEDAKGHTDLERLSTGELVYTGLLRTNLATIVNEVPINNVPTTVSSELFSISADIHRILGHISQTEYTCDTPDGKSKDIASCKSRLSRLVCADVDMLSDDEIYSLAEHIYQKQIYQVTKGLIKVVERTGLDTVIITDFGHSNICETSAKKLGLNIIKIENYISKEATSIITTIGAIQMYIDAYTSSEIKILTYI